MLLSERNVRRSRPAGRDGHSGVTVVIVGRWWLRSLYSYSAVVMVVLLSKRNVRRRRPRKEGMNTYCGYRTGNVTMNMAVLLSDRNRRSRHAGQGHTAHGVRHVQQRLLVAEA